MEWDCIVINNILYNLYKLIGEISQILLPDYRETFMYKHI
jgi:hypothetical protein